MIELESIESPFLRAEFRVNRRFLSVFHLRQLGAGKDAFPLIVVVDVVGLRVEDKLAGQARPALFRRRRVRGFRPLDLEQRTEHLVHGQERRGHPTAGLKELPAVEPQLLALRVR